MQKEELLLAGLAAGGENASFTPVQVQKLFFLIDREAARLIEGPYFNFQPYDYGPFDREVYSGLEELHANGLVVIQNGDRYRVYTLTQPGFQKGSEILNNLQQNVRTYIVSVANWIRSLTFEQLVASIYKRYPEMKAKSVFRG